jgi:hypothetical protein
MSIPLLPEFDADGYQVEPTTAKINEVIASANTAASAEIALLPEFDTDGQQVEPSTAKLNEIITALNDNGGAVALLPEFATDGYECRPSTARFNAVITAVNEHEPPASDPLIESISVSGNYPGAVTLPTGIVAGDLLLALVYWEDELAAPLDGFTTIDAGGGEYNWHILQYRIADGNETSPFAPDPDWALYNYVIARVSGYNNGDIVNVAGTPEFGGFAASTQSVELDAIAPDAAGTALITLAVSAGDGSPAVTFEGGAFDESGSGAGYAGGVSLEVLESSGTTGTRTVATTTTGNIFIISGAMVAINPA